MSDPTPPFIPSAASVPGAPPSYEDTRMQTIGTTALVLGVLQVVWSRSERDRAGE